MIVEVNNLDDAIAPFTASLAYIEFHLEPGRIQACGTGESGSGAVPVLFEKRIPNAKCNAICELGTREIDYTVAGKYFQDATARVSVLFQIL